MSEAPRPGPLEGVKVVDLTLMLAGPFCTQQLADLGAEVIKVESPDGDTTRKVGPYFEEDERRTLGGYFQSVNRNKRSLALNLKEKEGREVLLRLAADADVLVENFRVGVMDRLGLSWETLHAHNPRLVYATLRGFGDPRSGASPYAEWPAFDVVAQAMGGIMGITGPGPGQPMKVGPGVGDLVPALYLTIGILAALRHAQRTGEGQFVDVAMYDCILALCERLVHQYGYTGKSPGPQGNGHPLLCPFGLFPAKDGWVAIACPGDAFWVELTARMGRPELGSDERYALNVERVKRNDEVVGLLSEWTGRYAKLELMAILGGRVPFGPVQDAADIFADPHARVRSMLAEVEEPGCSRPAVIANSPIRMSAAATGVRRRGPLLGEDSDRILAAHGLSPEQIASLRAAGVVL